MKKNIKNKRKSIIVCLIGYLTVLFIIALPMVLSVIFKNGWFLLGYISYLLIFSLFLFCGGSKNNTNHGLY